MPIQPIQTWYADHHFRSRLEARWAVFFDSLGIQWEYEPQGYRVGPERRPYLPDFWLPKAKLWVEVKGAEEHLDIELLLHACLTEDGLPRSAEPYTISEHEVRMLVLGPLGRGVEVVRHQKTKQYLGYVQPTHGAIVTRKGEYYQADASFEAGGVRVDVVDRSFGDDSPQVHWEGQGSAWGNFVGGGALLSDGAVDDAVVDAYRAAISARFEHGESGASR
ncbi:hypothetical protein ABZ958_03295 [Streptomyces sp. NPDC046237]|uniref:hypothetical protein n=1 Tax=Streptomyces sp. NPDC046237 TaxID=3154914 RepID=UPI0033FA397F